MPRFRLRYQSHDLEVPPGEFVVGRSGDCQLALEDPLISRRHASFLAQADKLTVEDLGSRNGVKVNNVRIHGRVELAAGDLVTIGSQELVVVVSADKSEEPRRPAVTMTSEVADPGHSLALLSGVLDKALVMGRVEEAEKILQNLLSDTLMAIAGGRRDPQVLADATKYALRLAEATGKATWVDWVFTAHHTSQRVLPAQTIDELYTLVRKIRYPVTQAVKNYVGGLRERTAQMSPTERFALQRIEGLLRVMLA